MEIYKRTEFKITEFDREDVITTSAGGGGSDSFVDPTPEEYEIIL